MSKVFLVTVLTASAAVYDTPRALSLVSGGLDIIGPKLRSALSWERVMPKLGHLSPG